MSTLRFDSVGGASGDMILGALVDAGVPTASLQRALATLDVGPFTLRARRVTRDGIGGTHLTVNIPGAHHHHHDAHDHAHTHAHDHDHHHHHPAAHNPTHHDHDHDHDHRHHAPHRTFRTIRALIRRSQLPAAVKASSVAVFQRLAEAEGRIHRKPPEDVHFHEVGAVDSIVDIVGGCLALDLLGVTAVQVGPLPCGIGTIRCAHGLMPNPAPATTDLLRGHPVVLTDEPHELVTPTGAALLVAWQALFPAAAPAAAPLTLAATGTGFGTRTLHHRPNLLRALLFKPAAADVPGDLQDECLELVCNLDDMNPEWLGDLLPRLLAAGALDAFTAPVHMKKNRPGTLLTVLCHPCARDGLLDLIFRETTTFGVRERLMRRTLLARRFAKVKTPFGAIRVKEGLWRGRVVTRAPEHDDCARAADRHGVPLRAVYAAALKA